MKLASKLLLTALLVSVLLLLAMFLLIAIGPRM